jgi:hypothetical protein
MTAPAFRRRGNSSKVNAPVGLKDNRILKRLALGLLTVILLSGCMVMVPGHLYPIQGPLASQTPPPIYKITLSGVLNSGSLSATVDNGEVCQGNWTLIKQDDPTASQMTAQWDAVYGQGFFVAKVLGTPVFARAVLTSPKGATLNVQFYDPKPGDITAVVGIAQDSKGNLYKLTF